MIKNKLKLGYLVIAALMMTVGIAQAVDLTFSVDTVLDLTGATDITVKGGSVAQQVVVNAGTVVATLNDGDGTFTVTANVDLEVTGQSSNLAMDESCATGNVTLLVLTPQGADEIITITPQATACSGGGNGGGGGGGGGGSSDTSSDTDTESPIDKPISEMTIDELQSEIARITALINELIAAGGGEEAPSAEICSAAFNTDLAYGMVNNPEVKRMQEFMINKGHLASGYNTGKYANLTANAVGAYQTSKGIGPVPNNFGPLTRAAANADCGL